MSTLKVSSREIYNLKNLHYALNRIALMYGEPVPGDFETFLSWVNSARVNSYFKKLGLNYSFYDRALYLNESTAKFVKLVVVLFLTEVLGREVCEQVHISIEAPLYDCGILLFKNKIGSVDYKFFISYKEVEQLGDERKALFLFRR